MAIPRGNRVEQGSLFCCLISPQKSPCHVLKVYNFYAERMKQCELGGLFWYWQGPAACGWLCVATHPSEALSIGNVAVVEQTNFCQHCVDVEQENVALIFQDIAVS